MAFQEPVISIIVPCYNQAQYLGEALDSVLIQTYTHWECIVVNDGSTDDTEDIAKKYVEIDRRIIFISKENGGLPAARNTGINQACGIYILPLDADDRIAGNYLEKAIKIFRQNPNTSLVYGRAEYFGIKTGPCFLPLYHYKNLLAFNSIFCSAIFKKSDWKNIHGYDETLLKGYEDWEFWIRLLDENSVVFQLPDVVFFYRIKQTSMLTQLLDNHATEISWDIFFKHAHTYRQNFLPPQYLFHEFDRLNEMIKFYSHSKEYKLGRFLFSPFRLLKKVFHG